MGKPMMNLIKIKGYQTWLREINPFCGRKKGFSLCWEASKDFKCRHGTWCLGQVFHNNLVVWGLCIQFMCHSSNKYLQGVKKCVKGWIIDLKRATKIGIICCV
jgi:hypothetical protein